MYVRGIDYDSFYDFGIGFLELFRQCGICVLFFCFFLFLFCFLLLFIFFYENRTLNMILSVLLLKVAENIYVCNNYVMKNCSMRT